MALVTGFSRVRRGISLLALVLASLGQASVASATTPILGFSFDENFWIAAPTGPSPNGDPRPVINNNTPAGVKSSEIVIDTGTPYRTWLHSEVAAPGVKRTALGFQVTPSYTSPTHKKDKVQLSIADRANRVPTQIPFTNAQETRRYVAFEVMLDPTYVAPESTEFDIHFQLVQGGKHPIFTMRGVKSATPGGVDLIFYIANDSTADDECDGKPYHQEFYAIRNVQRGSWLPVVVQFIPPYQTACGRTDGCGQLRVYRDHSTSYDGAYNGLWGYTRLSKCALPDATPVSSFAEAGVGIYRSPQPTTQTIYFTNVKFGSTFSQVNTP